jgi:hypothetical protein
LIHSPGDLVSFVSFPGPDRLEELVEVIVRLGVTEPLGEAIELAKGAHRRACVFALDEADQAAAIVTWHPDRLDPALRARAPSASRAWAAKSAAASQAAAKLAAPGRRRRA